MTINILGIAGSPEIGGNTEILLDRVLEGCRVSNKNVNKEKIIVSELDIHPCTSCRSCAKTGECSVNDDMQYVYAKLEKANLVVIASPVYFMCVTAQVKALIDRCQMFWSRKYLLNRPIADSNQTKNRRGIIISTAGDKKSNIFDGLKKTIRSFFVTIDVVCDEENALFFSGIENRKEILDYPDYLQMAYNVGQNLGSSKNV
ncbi:MAG: flavodoxin family protein [Candidatus Anammoxibacter sp.]